MTTKVTPQPLSRPLAEIAEEIGEAWPKVREVGTWDPRFGGFVGQHPANPYWQVMREATGMTELEGSYGYDSIADVVRYFLSNATGWRGDKARAIKAELQAALELHREKRHRQLTGFGPRRSR